MISSSQFFEKDLFTIEAGEKLNKKKELIHLGPWAEESEFPPDRALPKKKKDKRYQSIDKYLYLSDSKEEKSNLLSQNKSLSMRRYHPSTEK